MKMIDAFLNNVNVRIEELERKVASLQREVDKLQRYSREHSISLGCISLNLENVNKELERKQDKEL